MNVLPRSIAERLKSDPETIADSFTSASILFADVVDFTPMAAKLTPAGVVGLLDQLFGQFDELVERYELEKIKTIGDCYMAAAGIPEPRDDHAKALALVALDMLDVVRRMARWVTGTWSCASASTPARWWRASSAASGSCTTCGAMR